MTPMIAELYDALLAAGSPEEKARKAAEVVAEYETYQERFVRIEGDLSEVKRDTAEVKRDVAELRQRVSAVERDLFLLKWMVGFVLAFQIGIFVKLFLH